MNIRCPCISLGTDNKITCATYEITAESSSSQCIIKSLYVKPGSDSKLSLRVPELVPLSNTDSNNFVSIIITRNNHI